MKKFSLSLLLFIMIWPCYHTLAAEKGHHHNHEHNNDARDSHVQSAHVHGLASLMLVAEGNSLLIRLESPSINLLGFEHIASTVKQKHKVNSVKEKLLSTADLFQFGDASCESEKTHIDLSAVSETNMKHDKSSHHDHSHHDHASEQAASHSNITANYHFICQQNNRLTKITVKLLDQFKSIEKLNIQWITEHKQGFDTLTSKSKTLHLQ